MRGIGKGGHVSVEGLESDYWMAVDIGKYLLVVISALLLKICVTLLNLSARSF